MKKEDILFGLMVTFAGGFVIVLAYSIMISLIALDLANII